jgi:hypothetical protein
MQGDTMNAIKTIVLGGFTQIKRLWSVFLFLYLPIVLLFMTLGSISRSSDDITLSYFTRDVVALGDLPFFAGLTSQVGGMLWSVALGICVFAVLLLQQQGRNGDAKRFLLQSAVLTGVLLLDDIFLVHEDIGPDYLHIGEKTIVVTYFLFTLFYLFSNRKEIFSSDYLVLGVALGMFATSIFFDAADLDDYDSLSRIFTEQFQTFLEDGFKFVGIATWLVYFARYSLQKIAASPKV